MKHKSLINIFLSILAVSIVSTGCVQKTNIKAIKAAKINDKSIKNIGVTSFGNDTIAQSSQIDSAISNVTINGEKYFTVVDRKNIDTIMKEKKLNDSGLVDLVKDNSSIGLKQIETLVTGNVEIDEMSSSLFLESRVDYSNCIKYEKTQKGKSYCAQYLKYNVLCRANRYDVKTNVKLVKVADASAIFVQTYEDSTQYKHCLDDNIVLPPKQQVNTKLAENIAQQLLKDIAPSYVYFSVKLLDDVDIELSDEQNKLFKTALKLIDIQRIQKANEFLETLNQQTASNSYVLLYNLGVTTEALGDIKTAIKLYKQADNIALVKKGVIEEISFAIARTNKNLVELEKVSKQLKVP